MLDEVVSADAVVQTAQQRAQACAQLARNSHVETRTRVRGALVQAVRETTEREFGSGTYWHRINGHLP